MKESSRKSSRAFVNISTLSLAPERERVSLEPGLGAWDQADGPTISQGADMVLHGLILAEPARKSNQTWDGSIRLRVPAHLHECTGLRG